MTDVQVKTLNDETVFVPESEIDTFRTSLRGPLLMPGDNGYDETRSIWNGMINRKPALIARCTGSADVIAAVNFAREHELLVSVRGGGHNIAGTAVCEGGLMIDLSLMNGVHVDPNRQRVWVQPGCTWGDVDSETQLHGFIVPGGAVSTTGVSGLVLGGGFGWLTRKWGWTSDVLRSVEIVTADGELRTASDEENADLFWGLRGGGGNFGIVTGFEFEAFQLGPTVIAGVIFYSMDDIHEVLDFFRHYSAAAPDEATMMFLARIAPPLPIFPEEIHGKPIVGIAAAYAGPLEEGETWAAPINEFGHPLAGKIGPMPFTKHQQFLDAGQPHGRHYYWKSEYLSEISDDLMDVIASHTGNFSSPLSSMLMMQIGGQADHTPAAGNAVPNRQVRYIINAQSSWEDPAETDRHIQWARDFNADILPNSAGTYMNFLNVDEGHDRTRAAYDPEIYERLVLLKNRFDPENLFRMNKNIQPTVEAAVAAD